MNAQRINTNSNGIICSQVEHKWQGGSGGKGGRRKGKRGKGVRVVGERRLYKSCCLEVQSILTLFSLLPQQFPPPHPLVVVLFICELLLLLLLLHLLQLFAYFVWNEQGEGEVEGGAASVAKKQMPEAAL